jgi:hypothetical protein
MFLVFFFFAVDACTQKNMKLVTSENWRPAWPPGWLLFDERCFSRNRQLISWFCVMIRKPVHNFAVKGRPLSTGDVWRKGPVAAKAAAGAKPSASPGLTLVSVIVLILSNFWAYCHIIQSGSDVEK